MRTRIVLASAAFAVCSASGGLAACASNEADPVVEPPNENKVPAPDAGLEAPFDAAVDAAPSDPCLPGALCPNGPFDANAPGGPLDVRTRINVIRGRALDDVWAVGARGAVVHFDGTSWRRLETGTIESFHGLWLRDADEVALVSLASLYTHGLDVVDAGAPSSDGWTANGGPPGPPQLAQSAKRLTSAWAPSDAEWLWCATLETPPPLGNTSVNGLWRLRVNPSTERLEIANALPPGTCTTFSCRQMTSIHGSSANDLWAVGVSGVTVHVTDAQSDTPKIAALDSRTWAGLEGVWAASENDVWAVGGGGVIRHYTGKPDSWDVVSDVPATETLHAVWGSSATDVWAVGDGGTVLHYDGKTWSRVNVGGLGGKRPDLYTVWTPAPGHVWAGGDGVILSLEGKP